MDNKSLAEAREKYLQDNISERVQRLEGISKEINECLNCIKSFFRTPEFNEEIIKKGKYVIKNPDTLFGRDYVISAIDKFMECESTDDLTFTYKYNKGDEYKWSEEEQRPVNVSTPMFEIIAYTKN